MTGFEFSLPARLTAGLSTMRPAAQALEGSTSHSSAIHPLCKLSTKLSNGATVTQRGRLTTTCRSPSGSSHYRMVLAQGIEP